MAEWADERCHLYLWVTNNALAVALPLLAQWGFAYKAVHTWTKPELGRGKYFRNTTEHVLFGVRGTVGTRSAGMATPTHHAWPVGEHSEKPEGFYDLVRRCSYPPFGEAFQRQARPDFVNLFRDVSREAAE
ncbi:MT-A70 family methyltransferase [Methylobacterium nodulans]|uniref:MT-A70 family protein n=1 Tax=Methylobacterium nodulans (strain LMG 21967 / CNCM I-2342 / ORS 2060) TaxID=460265 RepID=B8ILW5_METNO|nr:MT-A70 family methyltransferase [Methylobacterium nodulans]ACL62090.1 MT-A70 family protein [Methylobacterium nodulans ORS 2060]